jgi:hypothetical protein
MEPTSISEKLLFNTVRIETSSSAGQGTGTGYAFSYTSDENNFPFIVTNKHVISGADNGNLYFTRAKNGKAHIGNAYRLEIREGFENIWHGHPDENIDVAITPLVPLVNHIKLQGVDVYIPPIGNDLIPNEDVLKELDAIETITFIGYPNGIWDTHNFLPIMRRGTTATPITIDFKGVKQFLIDASVFPGSSGSPVFILNTGMYTNKHGTTNIASRLLFLGTVASVYFRQDLNEIKKIAQPAIDRSVAISKQMIDLGIVFKASTVTETIESFLTEKGIDNQSKNNKDIITE